MAQISSKKLTVKKQQFDPDSGPKATAAQEQSVDPHARQEAIGLDRRRGGAEDRSNEDDQALSKDYEAVSQSAPAVEIIEDD